MAPTPPTRQRIFDFIALFKKTNGYAPSVREIAGHLNIRSTSAVQYHLNHLERQGLITRGKERFRSIRLADEPALPATVPLVGTIAAGHPIWVPSVDRPTAAEQRRIEVPAEILQGKTDVFALEVKGNSMVDAMIADGDIVLLEDGRSVRSGDVAACWLRNEQEVTLKKVYFENGKVRLQPCNPYMMPLYHDGENVEIQGRVIAVLRVLR